MTRKTARFWVQFGVVSATWALASVWVIGGPYGRHPMSAVAQLALRGGQCPAVAGSCVNGCDANNDCASSTTGKCGEKGDSCDTGSMWTDGSGTLVCQQQQNAATGCANDNSQTLCFNVTQCVCGDYNEVTEKFPCEGGGQQPVNTGVCISGQ